MASSHDNKAAFSVDKTYLDCVTSDGRVLIGYVAQLRWHGISIPYTSVLYSSGDGVVRTKSRFARPREARKGEDDFRWSDPGFGVSGLWKADSEPLEETLFRSSDGALHWNCWFPRSSVELQMEGEPAMCAYGYAEHITLTVYPWDIPLKVLLWGRYVSKSHSIVWIEFVGPNPRKWIFHNGAPLETGDIKETKVTLPQNLVLEFSDSMVLEEGGRISEVVEALTERMPGFGRVIPDLFRSAREIKWRSRGALLSDQQVIDQGWVIHEKVRFRP